VAILGPNGSGKSSLLKVILGLLPLSAGSVNVAGRPPKRGSHNTGYIPQHSSFDRDLPVRGRDIVRLGLDGHKYGLAAPSADDDRAVAAAIAEVGAADYADSPIGLLSGGEQQRLRIAQALVSDPAVLLCDEPLLSLDMAHQQAISQLIDARRRKSNTAVLFVTHEINPILPLVDKILYIVGGKWAIGTPEEVLTTERLSELYDAPVDVLNVRGRIIVIGSDDPALGEAGGHHHGDHN
jgi:zinc/manganese transport system ATP-binding protein